MPSSLFRPSPRAGAVLCAIAALALGLASFMRYGLVEPSSVGLVCDAGARTAVCRIRGAFIAVFVWNGFGITALAAAAVTLWRPGTFPLALALGAGLLGVVLYNTDLSALALSVLPFALARPVRAPRPA